MKARTSNPVGLRYLSPSWRPDNKAVFYLFLDDNQNVREEAPDFDGMMPFQLTQNLRNTQRIFELSEQYQTSGSDVIPKGPEEENVK